MKKIVLLLVLLSCLLNLSALSQEVIKLNALTTYKTNITRQYNPRLPTHWITNTTIVTNRWLEANLYNLQPGYIYFLYTGRDVTNMFYHMVLSLKGAEKTQMGRVNLTNTACFWDFQKVKTNSLNNHWFPMIKF